MTSPAQPAPRHPERKAIAHAVPPRRRRGPRLHLAFVAFVVLGGWFVLRWRWLPWLHLPAAAWAVFVEWSGSICPLTHLENHFLHLAGEAGYGGGFVERYLWLLLYPQGLERGHQWALGMLVLGINAAAYAWVARSRQPRRPHSP